MTTIIATNFKQASAVEKTFFNEVVLYRIIYAAISYVVAFVSLTTWTSILLQASIFHPIGCVQSTFAVLTGIIAKFVSMVLATSCVVTILVQVKLLSCSSKKVDWRRKFLWVAAYFIGHTLTDLIFIFACISSLRSHISAEQKLIAYYTALVTGLFLSIEFFTLREYILQFPQYVIPKTQQFFADGRQIFRRLFNISWKQWLTALVFFFVAGHYIFRYLHNSLPVFNHIETTLTSKQRFKIITFVGLIWTSAICFLSTFFRRKFSDKLLNLWLCQPYEFEVPPADIHPQNIISNPSDDSPLPNLTQAMAAQNNQYLQYLAFWDLSRLSKLSKPRLHHLFQVSRPGGHPRPWIFTRDECLKLFTEFSAELQALNNILARNWESAVSQKKDSKNAGGFLTKMTSPTDPKKMTSPPAYDRKIDGVSDWSACGGRIGYLHTLEKFLNEKDIFEHCQLYVWIVESFGNIFCAALTEDRFGVVQRDLGPLLRLSCDTQAALERFGRLCGTQSLSPTKRHLLDLSRQSLKRALAECLKNVRSTYGEHMKSIDLDEDQRRFISAL